MGRSANDGPDVLDVVLHQWPSLIFLPTVLVVVATLVGVTRWWDRRDEARVTGTNEVRVAGTTARARWRPPWRREAVCTCSWHTMSTEVGAGSS
jgi:hypothetical protein